MKRAGVATRSTRKAQTDEQLSNSKSRKPATVKRKAQADEHVGKNKFQKSATVKRKAQRDEQCSTSKSRKAAAVKRKAKTNEGEGESKSPKLATVKTGNAQGACASSELPVSLSSANVSSSKSKPSSTEQKMVRPTLLFSFKCGGLGHKVAGITPVSPDKAWLIVGDKTKIQLRDKMGKKLREVDLLPSEDPQFSGSISANHMALDQKGNIFVSYSAWPESCIMKVTPDLETALFLKAPHGTRAIAINQSTGDLVIDACHEGDSYRGLSVISPDATRIRAVVPQKSRHYFGWIAHLAINGNGDVCISTGRNKVVVVDWEGANYTTYTSRSRPSMITTGICCDRHNNILVGDYRSKNIYMLDEDARFLQILEIEPDAEKTAGFMGGPVCPWSLAVDQVGHLWVGDDSGTVRVYSYAS